MLSSRSSRSLGTKFVLAAVICFSIGALLITQKGSAATPANGTLTNNSGPLTYTAGPFLVANPSAQANGTPICNAALPCDDFTLTVSVSPPVTDLTHKVKVQVQWPTAAADFDVYVLQGSTVIATAASSSDPEIAFLPTVNGVYTIRVVPFAPAAQSIIGTISLEPIPPATPGGTGPLPRYKNYAAPSSASGAASSGEPSIGVDWNPNVASLKHDKVNTGGVAFFTANLNEYRVSFDDCPSPANAIWEDVTSPALGAQTLDPIGFVDPRTGRVFHSQLAGATSLLAFSDDDGQTWTQSQGSGQPAGVDHQTVGGGPYNENSLPPPVHPLHPNAVYYASQDIATAFIARSDNGGLTFGPTSPMWVLTQCGGLHGHVKVGPDGTVYVPNKSCGGAQGVAVSTDNGLTWTVRTVPGSTPGDTDPSVGIGSDNTIYLGYQNGDGHPHMARSTDKGLTWLDRDAGGGFIQNSVFAEVVAGDGNRAAFGFLGTTSTGNYQDINNFKGVWHFYIASTFDRGDTYLLADATPNDPVQIGSICTSGTTCGSDRNLLDFNDISVDKEGRVLAAYADGCVAPGCTAQTATTNPPYNSSRSSLGTIIRQSGGRRLFAAFDPPEPAVPAAPKLISAVRNIDGVTVSWEEPDNGGSPITAYKIYRGTTSGAETFLAAVNAPTLKYLDATAVSTQQYFYRVTAVNAVGEGLFCGEVSVTAATTPPDPCTGIIILTDPTGDLVVPVGVTSNASWDLESLSLSEPFGIGLGKVVFTLKVVNLTTVPPNTTWPVKFRANGTDYVAQMRTTLGASDVVFEYGPSGGTLTAADSTSAYNSDGTITIVVPTSGIGNPVAGQKLSQFLVRVTVNAVAISFTPDNMPDSLAPSGEYTLVGNAFCRPNTAPIAVLNANPTSGNAPLTVTFDGSASIDADTSAPADTIATYTFDFGDGSAVVTQSTPTTTHTYTSAGAYRATLRVTDSRGKVSDNTAGVNLDVTNTTGSSTVQYSASTYSTTEGCVAATITVVRSGANTSTSTVDYSTTDGTAKQKSDYELAAGRLVFNSGETSKTFKILVTDDGFAEGAENLTLNLSNPTGGATLGAISSATFNINDNDTSTSSTTNVIDDPSTFVCQHYHDFLNRQGDSSGQAFWTQKITECGSDAACIQRQRIGVSAAFFIEQEFQQTGFYVYRAFKAGLGRRSTYVEFMTDRSRLQASANLDTEKVAYVLDFVQRGEFTGKYSSATTAQTFVDALIQTVRDNSNVDLAARRNELITEYNAGSGQADSRARALRKVIDFDEFKNIEYNRAFVLAQYFGYLRREPDTNGYNFWLNALTQNPSNYRGMVCAFITSFEYQDRFGTAHTHNNQECNGSP
ncbi:MAG TPA: Calx-beta domain-containing protein [Pyrinomonadaceae bacterium]|nr:Calx-beta domain-containing protein [Pyrinomonadaceae bacterium]